MRKVEVDQILKELQKGKAAYLRRDINGRLFTYGTIGGGCSESELIAKARRLIRHGGSEIAEVDMTNDIASEEGMVCGGTMRVLIETIESSY